MALPLDEGDRLADLFDAHHERLYRLARRLVPAADEALDLLQETYLRAAAARQSIPAGRAAEEAWLVRVLINLRRDQWRRVAVRSRYRAMTVAADERVDPEASLLTRQAVWRALDTLPPRRRAIVVMHELEGLPIDGIARVLGVRAVTVRWHLSVGRRALARELEPMRRGVR
jgi:RNA polymerase sigma-70 factor, ECF subfamily